MRDSAFVVFSKKGLQRMMKGRAAGGSRQRPQLGRGEFAVLVTFEVPDSIFMERPVPEATVRIPERQIIEAPIDVDVEDPPGPPDVLSQEVRHAGDNRESAGVSLLRESGDSPGSDQLEGSTPEPPGEVRRMPVDDSGPVAGSGAG